MEGPSAEPESSPGQPGSRRGRTALVLLGLAALITSVTVAAATRPWDRSATEAATEADVVTPSTTATTAATTTSTTTVPTTTTTTTPPPPGPERMTLAFSGDLLPHLPLNRKAAEYGGSTGARYDFVPMLAPMRPVLEPVDLAVCHLEVPVAADQDRGIAGYPSFGSPTELVDALPAVGFDACSTASNHSLDQGMAGLVATLDRFDQVGLRWAGTARTADEAASLTTYEVGGARVAHLSYTYSFNGYRLPADAPWAANLIDVERIRNEAALARAQGAQLVVVSLHWGTEYRHEPDAYQQEVAAGVLASPEVDVIIGHHAHVVQPIEQIDGRYVVWGLGNQLANQAQVPRSDGLTVVLEAAKQPDGGYQVVGVEAVPTFVEAGGSFQVWPVVPALADPSTPALLRERLVAAYDRTAAVLATRDVPGLTLAPKP